MPILSSVTDLHRILDALKELGVVAFCVICAALVLIEVLIPKFFQVMKVYQREKHAYLAFRNELQSSVARQRMVDNTHNSMK